MYWYFDPSDSWSHDCEPWTLDISYLQPGTVSWPHRLGESKNRADIIQLRWWDGTGAEEIDKIQQVSKLNIPFNNEIFRYQIWCMNNILCWLINNHRSQDCIKLFSTIFQKICKSRKLYANNILLTQNTYFVAPRKCFSYFDSWKILPLATSDKPVLGNSSV